MDIRAELKLLKCGILIPTYNNADTVTEVARQALRYTDEVYVVDDGSTDLTQEKLKELPTLHRVDYSPNAGKGTALKRGMKAMTENGLCYAISVDADGQHSLEDLPLLGEQCRLHPGALIAGTRNIGNQQGMPGKNSFANKFSNFWFKIETGMNFPDTQCGFRLYPITELQKHHYFSTKYEFELEVLVRSVWNGIELIAQPVHVYYPPEEERVTHFRPFRDFSRISVLNTILVIIALLYIKPRDFIRQLTWTNIKKFINDNLTHARQSNANLAVSIGMGILFGILPIWGFQIVTLLLLAQLLKLNKYIAVAFSNISLPPMIPFIIYGSYKTGGLLLGSSYEPDLATVNLKTIAHASAQYFVGATVLAIVCGLIAGLIAYTLFRLTGRNRQTKN